jgi:hypothetical protein
MWVSRRGLFRPRDSSAMRLDVRLDVRLFGFVVAVALYSCGGGGGAGSVATSPPHVTAASPIASPAALTFDGTGSAYSASIAIAEAGYTGTFTASAGNASIATVTPSSSSSSFTVTPVSGGTTSVAITDAFGQLVSVSVNVTSSIVEPEGHP